MSDPYLYHGMTPGYGFVAAEYSDEVFLTVGENTFETWAVKLGETFEAGTIVSMDEATGELVACDNTAGATAGAIPYGIALHPVDATAAASSMAVLVRTMGTLKITAVKWEDTGYSENEIRILMKRAGLSLNGEYYSAI